MHLSKNCAKCWRLGINKNAHSTDGKTEEVGNLSSTWEVLWWAEKVFWEHKGAIRLLMNQERFSGKDDT